jgi:nickel transport protein
MKSAPAVVLTLMLAGLPPALGHDLQHTIAEGDAVVVKLSYPDNTPFSYESYEVFRTGEKRPFQIGRTDNYGRIVFLPDRRGEWRVRAFSEDGHGVDFTFETDKGSVSGESTRASLGRGARILVGLAILFGVFGIVSLLYGRRKT